MSDIFVGHRTAMHQYFATVGMGDAIDDANQTGFTCAIRAQQSIDRSIRHLQVNMTQGYMIAVFLTDIGDFYK